MGNIKFNKRFKILVAENKKVVRETLELALLSSFKCDVDLAAIGEEAVELALDNSYDLVIINIRLPDMESLEVVRLIKQTEKNNTISILAMTTDLDNKTKQRWIEAGVNDFLIKPFTLAAIKSALKNLNFIS